MTKYRFDEIAINSTQKKKPTEEDKVYYIGLEHIDPGCFDVVRWGSDVAPIGDKLLMQKGDVLFGKRRAYQRKVAIAPFDGIFSAHGMVLRPNLKVIDANYFPFFISSDKFMETAVRISVGGLSPTINRKDLARQEFELPSLDEQKVLADKLWAAYRLKEAYKKLLVATDEMVKSQFIEMFKNAAPIAIRECGYVATGTTPPTSKPEYYFNNDIQFFKPGDLTDNVDMLCQAEYQLDESARSISRVFPKGTVMVTCIGSTIGKVGITSVEATCNQQINYIIPNKNFNSTYLAYAIHVKRAELVREAGVTAVPILNKTSFSKIEIENASIELQNKFAAIYKQADKSKFELKQCIEHIDKVIKSLING